MTAPTRRHLALLVIAALAVLGAATAGPATAAPATAVKTTAGRTVHYAVEQPVCATPASVTAARCFALHRVDVPKGTAGADAYSVAANVALGPAGGYTPADLATAYGYNPALNRTSQLVAVVDWYDDPSALRDLNAFDAHYGLAQESATSFRKVNQSGKSTPLPAANASSSVEIALDVEAVRSVCHTCRILLVEANDAQYTNLAAAENTAAAMGSTEISNSFGGPEGSLSSTVLAAFNHPGVVITASTGDDGWYGWDYANDTGQSDGAASFPATDPTVVAVGGTTLQLAAGGTRQSETVWNDNGPEDQSTAGGGATGGGCSTTFAAPAWQAAYPGYTAAGCNGKRLAADVSVVADPATGFDILDSYAYPSQPWLTVGGTSLSSPVTAALFALAGGSAGQAYPAATLYTNGTHRPSGLFDVTQGGSGYCGGVSVSVCASDTLTTYGVDNPNALGAGALDCSFPTSGSTTGGTRPLSSECNAVVGYDGPSGLGTPVGLVGFTPTNPSVVITRPAQLRVNSAATFTARAVEPVAGIAVSSYTWSWGDGRSTRTTAATSPHTYTRAGSFAVALTVTDSAGQSTTTRTTVTLGRAAGVRYAGPTRVQVAHTAAFSVAGSTDPNTGGRITSVTWRWGDGKTSTGARATHRYTLRGTFSVSVVLVDNTGVRTTVVHRVSVV